MVTASHTTLSISVVQTNLTLPFGFTFDANPACGIANLIDSSDGRVDASYPSVAGPSANQFPLFGLPVRCTQTGETTLARGDLANVNPIRFSTKHMDDVWDPGPNGVGKTGLVVDE